MRIIARPRLAEDTRTPARIHGYAPIADYAVIGDGRTVALVAADGSIDWLAMPNIAAEPLLDALLDAGSGRSFRLAPVGEFTVSRRYLPETNVLETTFHAASGVLRVTDAFTTDDGELLPWLELVRKVECVAGSVEVEWQFSPSEKASGRFELHTWDAGDGRFELTDGGTALFALVFCVDGPLPAPDRESVEGRVRMTADWWERWVERHQYDGPWAGEVLRSALALKLLTHSPTGAMAAAATTSLPEKIGGDRNWDYRFSWVRDSSFAIDALLRIGRLELVHSALRWLLDAVERTHPRLNVLYALDGGVPDQCEELPLPGYRGSHPVRKGNTASPQLQLGCYGDLLDTVSMYVQDGNDLGPDVARRIAEVASFTCRIWMNEDSGIWELDDLQHYTSSKMDCWVALDRALELAERGTIPAAEADDWRRERERVRDFVERRCWSEQRGSYTFYAGTDELDAAVLLAARTEFADPKGE